MYDAHDFTGFTWKNESPDCQDSLKQRIMVRLLHVHIHRNEEHVLCKDPSSNDREKAQELLSRIIILECHKLLQVLYSAVLCRARQSAVEDNPANPP